MADYRLQRCCALRLDVCGRGLVTALVSGACSAAALAQPSFHRLGFLTPDNFGPSIAHAISPDGTIVVGLSNSPQGVQAFRWTLAEGMVGLGALANTVPSSSARCVSADGNVVGGCSLRPDSFNEDGSPFRWTQSTGPIYIGNLGGNSSGGCVFGVSADGTVLVGFSDASEAFDTDYRAFRWTEADGMTPLPTLPNQVQSVATAISDDKSVIVGAISFGTPGAEVPVRWTNQGVEQLPVLAAGTFGRALDVTPDGSITIGTASGRAVRWVGGNVEDLGVLPGQNRGALYFGSAGSSDGSVVVGLGDFDALLGTGTAVISTPADGMRDLNQVLVQDFQLDLGGFRCFWATAISADGLTIAGYGFNVDAEQEAFVADLHSTPDCPADVNHNGQVDLSDLTILLQHFGTTGSATPDDGDVDGDGDVDINDLNALLVAFGTSCP